MASCLLSMYQRSCQTAIVYVANQIDQLFIQILSHLLQHRGILSSCNHHHRLKPRAQLFIVGLYCSVVGCAILPPQPDNIAVSWNCTAGAPLAHGTVCNATTIGNCSTGFTRPNTALTATCSFGQWVYTGGCVAAGWLTTA